jgi:hypothetical protein
MVTDRFTASKFQSASCQAPNLIGSQASLDGELIEQGPIRTIHAFPRRAPFRIVQQKLADELPVCK